MKVAVFSDLHAHAFRQFDRHSYRTGSERLDHIVDTLIYIANYCKQNEIPQVLFGGDMFHVRARVNTIVYNSIYDTIKEHFVENDIRITGIAGNHDQVDHSDVPQHSMHAFNDLPGVHIHGNLAIDYLLDGTPIVCVPYSKNVERIRGFINGLDYSKFDKKPIMLFHLGIAGGLIGMGNYPMAEAFTVDDLRPDDYHYIVGGHFHRRQFLGGHPHVLYTGAPIQHEFGDEGEDKGFVVIDTSKRWQVDFVPIPNPRFFTVSMPITKELLQVLAEQGDYIRVQMKESQVQDFMSIVPQRLQYKIELQREYAENTRVDVKIGMGFPEIIAKYADEFNPDAKEIGLKILEEVEGK